MKHRLSIILTVALLQAAATGAHAGELIVNGAFETGAFGAAWQHGAFRGGNTNPNLADHFVALDLPYSGNYSALLGFKYTTQRSNTYAWMYQQVAIPPNVSSATLRFKFRMQGYDSSPYDPFRARIRNASGNTLATFLDYSFTEWNDKFKDSGWLDDDNVLPVGFDVSGWVGQTVQVYFEQSNLFDALYETWTYVDDVSLIYRMWVDLAVDGDGDDVFGAPGTGQGGLSARSGVAGDTLTYQMTVENEGTIGDTYQLSATAPVGWTVLIDAGAGFVTLPVVTPALSPGASLTYPVRVVPPVSTLGGSYDVIVNAVSTSVANRNDSVTLRANVVDAIYAVDAVIDGNGVGVIGAGGAGGFGLKEAPWDSALTYSLEVFNNGNSTTAFVIGWTPTAGAVASITYNATTYLTGFNTLPVAPGGSALMTLSVTGPAPILGGDYQTIVRAVSANDTLRLDSVRAVMRLRAPRLDLIIANSGNDIYDATSSGLGGVSSNAGEPGSIVNFPLTVQNESVLPDSFVMNWVPPAAGWAAVLSIGGVDYPFPTTTPTLAPLSQAQYILRVTIPGGAAFGTYASILNAASRVAGSVTESVTATISAASPSEMDMTIDGDGQNVYGPVGTGLGGTSVKTAAPGDTVTFDVVIENILGLDSFEVSWNTPTGWTVTLGGQTTPVSGLTAGTYTLVMIVPAASLGGTFDVIVDAHKSDKIFFMDSVTGRVVVTPPAVVDGIIDGSGDDAFGALGSGAGGSSQQVTSTPAALNFTVEVQNQGPASDSYRVTWNTLPLWTATFGGGASPFLTSSIGAGATGIHTFTVSVPAGALVGSHVYVIDIVSTSDPTSFESIAARIDVVGPPRVDMAIDGDGAGVFGPLGTGQGGRSVRAADPGASYTSVLRVQNVGSFVDSFRVQWDPPAGWPAASVSVALGATAHFAPFWTTPILPGQFVDYDVSVQVPPGISGVHTTIINSWSSLPPNQPESVALITQTQALVRGVVFDDADHDGIRGAGEGGLPGVTVVDLGSGTTVLTAANGSYAMLVGAGATVTVYERNPAGFISMSPDTLGPFAPAAGDTITADFGDVPPLYLSPGAIRNGLSGGYVDFPHRVEAGTAGGVALAAANEVGAVTMFLYDENGNGSFDGNDRALIPADLALDPASSGAVAVLLRVFIPAQLQPGQTFRVTVDAVQTLAASTTTSSSQAFDAVLVTGSALGRLSLAKNSDRATAAPGELITYSITFFNLGTDSLQNVVLLDPVSAFVDLELDGFGPGLDLEWTPGGGAPIYLTFDAGDPDECEYSAAERLLRLLPSKNAPYFVAPGGAGVLRYRVRVR